MSRNGLLSSESKLPSPKETQDEAHVALKQAFNCGVVGIMQVQGG